MSAQGLEPQVLDHLRVLNRYRVPIALIAALVALAVYGMQARTPATYQASTVVRFIVPEVATSGGSARDSAQLLAGTYVETSSAPAFAERVKQSAPGAFTVSQVQARLRVAEKAVPGFLAVTATGPSGKEAAALADAGAATLAATIGEDQQRVVDKALDPLRAEVVQLDAQLAKTDLSEATRRSLEDQRGAAQRTIADRQESLRASVVGPDPAPVPSTPVAPHPTRAASVAFIIAIVLASEGFVLARYLRGSLSLGDPAGDLERIVGVPSLELGAIGRRRPAGAILPFVLQHLSGRPVISVVQRNGAPTALPATEIADALARIGTRVLLVDADVRTPVLHDEIGVPLSPGLVEVTTGAHRLNKSVHLSPTGSGAVVLSAGAIADRSPVSVLGNGGVTSLVRGAGADTAVILTSSAAPLEDALLVVHQFPDAVVVAVDIDRARRSAIVETVRTVRSIGGNVVGTLCVHTKPRRRRHLRRSPR